MNLKDLLPSVDIMSCGCKGIRVCSLCIDSERVKRLGASASSSHNHLANFNCYVYKDGCAFLDTQLNYHSTTSDVVKSLSCLQVADHDNATSFPIDGIAVLHDFLSYDEEEQIVISMDSDEWLLSQSGRRKQVSAYSVCLHTQERLLGLRAARQFQAQKSQMRSLRRRPGLCRFDPQPTENNRCKGVW